MMQIASSIKQRLSESDNVKLVSTLLHHDPAPSRHSLAKELCRRLNLRDFKGDWQIATTSKALRDLEEQGRWKLPESLIRGGREWNPRRLNHRVPAPKAVPKLLAQVKGLRLVEVFDQEHLAIWNELMIGEHPLKDCRLVGRQLRYLIGSDHGWLGGFGFGSAALHLQGRDQWIGWSRSQRGHYLERVINMSRFLIRRGVRCPNLASHALALCARRVGEDFQRRYGLRPWLLESFVETPTYEGSCYKAANWIRTGQTKGRGRNGAHDAGKSIKDVYVYRLVNNFQDRVGVKPRTVSALSLETGLDSSGWVEQEFGQCELGHERLRQRLIKIVGDQAAHPDQSYALAAAGNRHDLKSYYRFLNNHRAELNPESLLRTHRQRTLQRMKANSTVLIVQDTMELNFSTRSHCEGLGEIGTNQTGAKTRGLCLHSSLALSPEGLPLGVVRLHGYAPQWGQGKQKDRPIEDKQSVRWLQGFERARELAAQLPGTQVVSVADREADMFELFDCHRRQQGRKAELLIRAKTNRCLAGTERKLFAQLAAAPLAQVVSIPVPRQREKIAKPSIPGRVGLPARQAQVQLRFQLVTLSAPNTAQTRNLQPIPIWAVYLIEKDPPAGATPLEWLLLTTLQVSSAKQALKCVRWYCRRWRIEEWHRILKSGCKILERQNHSAKALLRAIALDTVIAWRIMLLALLGREVPELPCQLLFNPWECQVLELLSKKK